MSKLLTTLIKKSITPASFLIASKFIGIYLAINIFKIPLIIDNQVEHFFSIQLYTSEANGMLIINSFSDFVMLTTMFTFGFYIALKNFLIQRAAGNPRTLIRITKFNMLNWLTSEKNIFIATFSWAVFNIFAAASVIANSINDLNYKVLLVPAVLALIITLWYLVKSFEFESAKIYPEESHA